MKKNIKRSIIKLSGDGIEAIKKELRKRGYLVAKAKCYLEIIVTPKEKEEVEKILQERGCYKKSLDPQKNFSSF